MTDNPTALSFWFPKLLAAGIPVQRTKILTMPEAAQEDVWDAFDGKGDAKALLAFADDVKAAGVALGVPFFLRTDFTSAKHNWKDTCFVNDPDLVVRHLVAIAEFSEIADMSGELRWDTWAVREMLPSRKFGVCPLYGEMPIAREYRVFVKDRRVTCLHPYWPLDSLREGGAPADLDISALDADKAPDEVFQLAFRIGDILGGEWSVDILDTDRGWFVTDLAEARKSYHWEGCPVSDEFERGR